MVENESMSFVDPNKYIDFRELSRVRVGDYVLDPDGNPYMQVLGWNKNNDLICRQYERDLSNDKGTKSHYREGNKIAISPEQHLNLVFRRYDSGSNKQLSEEVELQINECLRSAGILNESGDVNFDDYIEEREYEFDILNDRFWKTLTYKEVEAGLQFGDVLYSNFIGMPIAAIQSSRYEKTDNNNKPVKGYDTLSYYSDETTFVPEWYFLEKVKSTDSGVFPYIIRRHK